MFLFDLTDETGAPLKLVPGLDFGFIEASLEGVGFSISIVRFLAFVF